MSRRSLLLAVGILFLLACGGGTVLLLLLRYVPRDYLQAAVPPGEKQDASSKEFSQKFFNLYSAIGGGEPWEAHFTDEQINSYFDKDFVQSGLDVRLLPQGVSQPRVLFEPDRVCLAFRYGAGFWSTVISIDLRVWLPQGEPNAVALQVLGFRAGALPISTQTLMEPVSDMGRLNNIDVSWYRHEGYPVALLRFQADQPRATLQLDSVQLDRGVIWIRGRSNEPSVHAGLHSLKLALKTE
jgi:hypothetical protein